MRRLFVLPYGRIVERMNLMTRGCFLAPILLGLMAPVAFGDSAVPAADGVHVPPGPVKAAGNPAPVLSPERVAQYVAAVDVYHVYDLYADATDDLSADALAGKGGPLRGGRVVEVGLRPEDLFQAPVPDGSGYAHLTGVTSAGAEALRLQADLRGLGPGDEVWVLDPVTLHAFGPVLPGEDDAERWLPAIQGEQAVLLVRSPRAEIPGVSIPAYSHIFLSFREAAKALGCNFDVACADDAEVLDAASAAAILLVGGDWFCSGFAVNNALTDELEPYLVTANHCVCSGAQAQATEVYWDYRNSACDADDAPDLSLLPRSQGVRLLATSSLLDITLMRLDNIPVGDYGRTYLGWDTRNLAAGDEVVTIHHPDATEMRVSFGRVVGTEQVQNKREHQVKVRWYKGVTESGSSGACLLSNPGMRVLGALSQGPAHTCGPDRSGNLDWYASFRDFYPQIQSVLDTPDPVEGTAPNDCKPFLTCPFRLLLQDDPAALENLRAMRDKMLRSGPGGRAFVGEYYRVAPAIARALHRMPFLVRAIRWAAAGMAQGGPAEASECW